MFLNDPNKLVFEYTKYYDLMNYFKEEIGDTLLIGGAAYSYPKHYLNKYSDRNLDVIEIDPKVTEIAKEYFELKQDYRLNIFHQDGRIYLNQNTKKYDVILNDAFTGNTPPFHLSTHEAIEKVHASLNDGGVYITNIIDELDKGKNSKLKSEILTLKSVFDNVYVFPCSDKEDTKVTQNIIVVATKDAEKKAIELTDDEEMNKMLSNYYSDVNLENAIFLTDDYAPVDYWVSE